MKYLKWLLMAVIDVLFNVIAYVTDPFILLFADEVGNLPGWALWWENWDDHLDVDWMIDEGHVPGFACYDFHRHYRYHPPEEAEKPAPAQPQPEQLLDEPPAATEDKPARPKRERPRQNSRPRRPQQSRAEDQTAEAPKAQQEDNAGQEPASESHRRSRPHNRRHRPGRKSGEGNAPAQS